MIGPRRLATLRAFPGFARLGMDELAAVSALAEESLFPRGAPLGPPGTLHLILDGAVRAGTRVAGARESVGLNELLAGGALDAVAERETRTLAITGPALLELFEESFGALFDTVRAYARRAVAAMIERRATVPPLPRPVPPVPRGPLGYGEKLLFLHGALPHPTTRIEATAELARLARWERHPPGRVLGRAGEPTESAVLVVAGEVECTIPGGPPARGGTGTPIGWLTFLAGMPLWFRAETATEVTALRIEGRDVVDVLEDHPDFAIDLLRTLATLALALG